jgi:hypothetical protein
MINPQGQGRRGEDGWRRRRDEHGFADGWIISSTLSTSGRCFLGGSGKRSRATDSALSKSSTLSQACARMRSEMSSSQTREASMSNAPFSRWSTNWMPSPVTAHCLPTQ